MDHFAIRVMLADDHPTVIAGLLHTLNGHRTINILDTAANSDELLAALGKQPCDVLVSDYAMPGGDYGDGITLFSFLRRRYPAMRIVVLSMIDNPGVIRALLKLGIQCILSKADANDHLITAIHGAHAQERYFSPTIAKIVEQVDFEAAGCSHRTLTAREFEVVRLFVSGLWVNQIAAHLKRSKQTVSSQKVSAMRKLGVDTDTHLIKHSIGATFTDKHGNNIGDDGPVRRPRTGANVKSW